MNKWMEALLHGLFRFLPGNFYVGNLYFLNEGHIVTSFLHLNQVNIEQRWMQKILFAILMFIKMSKYSNSTL